MPPRGYTAPPPYAARNFKCDLCNKSYSRQNDYDTHLSSYDHSHRARMIEMKRITADNAKPRPTKRLKRDEMSAPVMPQMSIKKKSGGGFTKIQDLAKKQAAEEVKKDVEEDKAPVPKQAAKEFKKDVEEDKAPAPKLAFSLPAPNVSKEKYFRVLLYTGGNSKPITDEEIGYGKDEDYGPDYYDPTQPTPCEAIGCKCGGVPAPKETSAGITA